MSTWQVSVRLIGTLAAVAIIGWLLNAPLPLTSGIIGALVLAIFFYLVQVFNLKLVSPEAPPHYDQNQNGLKEDWQRLHFALEATLDGIWDWNIETGHVYFSTQWCRLLGLSPAEVPQRVDFFYTLVHPDDVPFVTKAIDDHFAGRTEVKQGEIRLKTKDGSYRWFLDRGLVVSRNGSGHPLRMVGTITDISERKWYERRIESSARLGRQLHEVETNLEAGRLIADVAEELLGWDSVVFVMFESNHHRSQVILCVDQIGGKKVEISVPLSDELLSKWIDRVKTEGSILLHRHQPNELAQRRDGTFPSASLLFVPLRNGASIVGMLSIQSYSQDAYDRSDLETLESLADQCGGALSRILGREALAASERRLRDAQSISGVGNFSWDALSDFMTWSDELYHIHGKDKQNFIPSFDSILANVFPEDREKTRDFFQSIKTSRGEFNHEYRLLLPDQDVRWVRTRGRSMFNLNQEFAGVEGTCQDIHVARQTELTLRINAIQARIEADVSAALTETLPLQKMLQKCTMVINEGLGAAFTRIWTLNANTQELILQASAGMYTHLDGPHSHVAVGHLKIGRIAADLNPHFTNRVFEDPWIGDPEWVRREGLIAFAGYPMVVEGKLKGVLATFSRTPFPDTTLDMLAATARVIALGISRYQSTQALLRSEARYRAFISNSTEGIWRFEVDPPIPTDLAIESQVEQFLATASLAECNIAMARMYGYDNAAPMIGRRFRDFLDPADDRVANRVRQFIENNYRVTDSETREPDRLGQLRVYINNGVGEVIERKLYRVWGTQRDVTERAKVEESLRVSIHEKETLIREVHHRVKNNLQIISSLLYFQSQKITDATGQMAINECRDRLKAMVIIHQKLYQSHSLSCIDVSEYIGTLVRELQTSYASLSPNMAVELMVDHLEFTTDIALPVGMLCCELVTNAFKYAKPATGNGRIAITIRKQTEDRIELVVTDDGPGLPLQLQKGNQTGFGWQLIDSLVRQLNAKLKVTSQAGTSVQITFPWRAHELK